ncbi:MAG: carboxylate--amine ligase [Alphaproteobacteria bacterium]|nr:carboxylate--amine ligase [Alphaproteobacteria bacterium]
MTKILIAGAGGAPSEGVINSLLKSKKHETIIGMGSEPTDLVLSHAERKYYVPYANRPEYKNSLLKILEKEKPDLIHFQNDLEIYYASLIRDDIHAAGTKMFMPPHDVIDTCVNKFKSYLKFKQAGIKVPVNMMINDESDLKRAFAELGDEKGTIWLRSTSMGGGGKGSIPTNDYQMAKCWIDRANGWKEFIAAEMLTSKTVTWLSIWFEGELIVAQTRKRSGWIHGNRTASGVTGVTKVGQTCSDDLVTKIAMDTVKAVSDKPHGIFGVDMAYDADGVPNPTEINISRFFTTVLFFTEAGLNMPEIFKDLALYGEFPKLEKKINPLPDGLMWMRGMDTKPRLMTAKDIEKEVIVL